MKDERRINIRVDPATFDAWNDKRHQERTSFQQIGMDLFSGWYTGEPAATGQLPEFPYAGLKQLLGGALERYRKDRKTAAARGKAAPHGRPARTA